VIADSFIGRNLPDVALRATNGEIINLAALPGWCVVFVYPYTGRPGFSDPPHWDNIKGAHGSTPQALAFSDSYAEYEKLSVKVYGLSLCSAEWQSEFVLRNHLRVPLLSDEEGRFSQAFGISHFETGSRDFLTRITLIVKAGKVEYAYFPDPHNDAAICLGWLEANA
jgi:peroxiredoxin